MKTYLLFSLCFSVCSLAIAEPTPVEIKKEEVVVPVEKKKDIAEGVGTDLEEGDILSEDKAAKEEDLSSKKEYSSEQKEIELGSKVGEKDAVESK